MAKQRKNTYRLTFIINEQRAQFTAHTQAEAASVRLHVKRLIISKKTGAPCIESEEWAQTRPKGALKDFLIRWRLIEDAADQEKTIGDLYKVFVIDGKEKPRTLKNRQNCFNNLIQFFGKDCPLKDITRQRAEELIKHLERRGNAFTGEGLGDNTLGGRIKRFKQFFKYALEEGWIKENPFSRFKAVSKTNIDRWQYISKEDVIDVIDSTANKEHKVIIALVRFCGLRGASELSRLTFDESCLHLSTDKKPGELVVHSTKVERHAGHEQRKIPLTPYVEKLICDLWETIPEGESRFFPKMKATSNIGVIVKKVFMRYGVNIGQMYNLRKSYVTDLMAGGLHETDPKMFEMLAGHDVRVSLAHYQIISDERKERAAEKFLSIMDTQPDEESGTHLGTHFGTHSVHKTVHSGILQYLPVSNINIDDSPEKPVLSQDKKSPCEISQGLEVPPAEVYAPSQDPIKTGLLNNADNASTHFDTHSDYIEQIIDLFDRLDVDKQEALLKMLQDRSAARIG